jgi:hypothetical protein
MAPVNCHCARLSDEKDLKKIVVPFEKVDQKTFTIAFRRNGEYRNAGRTCTFAADRYSITIGIEKVRISLHPLQRQQLVFETVIARQVGM